MKALAVIPARGGSKGIPRKNVRTVGGKPLIAWSIEAGLSAKCVDRVIVSSDDEEILRVAERYGAQPLERPAELATDTAATDPVLVHALKSLEQKHRPEAVILLQPTVPTRRPGLVDDCFVRLMQTGADSLLTAYQLHFVWRPMTWVPEREGGGWRWTSEFTDYSKRPRRQDRNKGACHWHEDGSVYVTRTELLEKTGNRLGGDIEVFETERTVDIDTEADLAAAGALLYARAERIA